MYSYYTNFLKYEYNKFKVRNSDMLAANLKEYDNYKYVVSRYDSIRNIMRQTQDLLEKFLRDKKIEMDNVSIEKFANTISIDDKMEYCRDINSSKKETEEKLKKVAELEKGRPEPEDQHEASLLHIRNAEHAYLELAEIHQYKKID